jgi:GntR family transcriptional regulator, transcriptional repressor for pyruvate dehydrogenase complex
METHWTILPPGNVGITTDPVTASDKTENILRALIFSGQLGPADKLPSERLLAAQLNTSRPTLRTALRALEALGFISVKIGSKGGFWVTDAETISRRWRDWMHANQDQIEEMLDFRRWAEVEIARRAAERRTAKDVEILENCLVAPEADRLSLVRWHFGLHDALATAAHNKYLEQAMASIRGQLFAPVDTRPVPQRVGDVVAAHAPVIAAVCAGDSCKAAEEMTLLVERSEVPFRK